MNIKLKSVLLNNEVRSVKIKHANYDWNVLILNKELLFETLCELIFNRTNMFFYLTQKASTKTLAETRTFIKKLENQGLLTEKLNSVFNTLGWNKETLNIESSIFQGDLAEYLMSILIDMFGFSKTLISKISLKTSPNMPVYGNDNVYYDINKSILYFGESKFYESIDVALKNAFDSIEKHKTITEISFLENHTNNFIAENGETLKKLQQKFETLDSSKFDISSICFVAEDELYLKSDIENVIRKYEISDKYKKIINNSLIIILPILSKKDFLKYFKIKVGEYYV